MTKLIWNIALSILFVVISLQIGHAQVPGNELFSDAAGSYDLSIEQKLEKERQDPTVVRSRSVVVNFTNIVNIGALQGEDIITLNFFDDVSFTAIKDRLEKRGANRYTWFGSIKGLKHSQVILTVENGSIAGNITVDGQVFQVRGIGNGIHSVREIDQSAFPDEIPPTPIDVGPDELDVPEGSMLDDGSIIDIMVVYTAAAAVGGDIAAEIQLAVDETNQSYANSGINPRLNLVHTSQVTYTETGDIRTDRNRLQSKTDGYMDNVHTLRDTYDADMVTLWVANGEGYCGIAYIMTTVSTSFENYGFQVTKRTCATGKYSFGHEFGHIQSARHDWYVDSNNNSPYTYNHGYVDPGDAWRTIMAYSNDCSGCSRIQYWSNPDVLYSGQPMGVPEGQYHAADNRKTLNNTAWTVANFRQSVPTISADIKANGSDGPLTITQNDPLSVTIGLNAAGYTDDADWWVLADTPFGWYRYDVNGDTWVPGQTVTYQGPLFDLSSYEVLNMSGLPLGSYTFYFGVDTVMNGSIDMGQIYYDSVDVNISAYNPCNVMHDVSNASHWFGGDDRTTRNVGVGQSITLQSDCNINSVGFRYSGYFDYAQNPEGHGHDVTLVLNVRSSDGSIINTLSQFVPASFNGGWVLFAMNQNLSAGQEYIFTCYLQNGEILQYNSGVLAHTQDMLPNSNGYRAIVYGAGADMENWISWGTHSWDFNFQMTGTPTP
jgi:hypothetical protein